MARDNPGSKRSRRIEASQADAPAEKARSLAPLRLIFSEALRYPDKVAYALLALMVTAAATLAIPAALQLVIDRGFADGGDPGSIARWFRYLFLIVCVLALGTALRFYFVSWLGERVVANLRLKVQQNLLRQEPAFYEANSPKEISSRLTSDTAIIEQVVGTTLSVALRNVLIAVGGTIYLFVLAPRLTAMLIIAIPVIIVPITLFARRLRSVSRASQDRVADVGSLITETLSAMAIVQAFTQERREQDRFAQAVERIFDTARRRILIRSMMTGVVITLAFGAIVLLMWRGAVAVTEGTITGGTIGSFVLTGVFVAGAFGALTEVYGDLLRGAGAADRLAE
ncbi:ABC transporter transmembrane domain-containing protein, partial [Henriciella sp.]